nr:hypothetical protein [Rhodoferax sp.]
MILRSIIFIGAVVFSCNLLAAQPVAPAAVLAPNANTPIAKVIKLPPAEPEVQLSIFVFDSTSNPNSGVEVTQNGKMWGSCRWGGLNAQPVTSQPATKLCKFSAPRGTAINLTQSPGGSTLAGFQCNAAGTGMCYKTAAFTLARDGQVEAAFNIKP